MGHRFEDVAEIETPASVEDVWAAITTGPGVQSWFLGRTEIDGDAVRMEMGDYRPESRVTAYEPGKRFAHRVPDAPDGRFMAYEYLVEGRDRASTVVRVVTSGFLPGDDWADEYEAMLQGNALFVATLREYVTHFTPRTGVPLTRWGGGLAAWDRLPDLLGIDGDTAHTEIDGVGVIDGAVFHRNDQTIGIRTADALYRFIRGMNDKLMLGHVLFAPVEQDWDGWLGRHFA
ncbi:SRPBCC family protein [Actinokineospora fastidiosa]|uniref:SRPBCC domain-containing protein n=1 Tax=Actinokineospora fastidiosa TaxID=1816 RepID=A0A918LE14_9PSEU|nr:SRPBCC domain-containing protein [Actinokineospora fastidiosa]GGS36702.1 hypothetical protein GCM10010171_34430 [Actinokineospora fastidiosa]